MKPALRKAAVASLALLLAAAPLALAPAAHADDNIFGAQHWQVRARVIDVSPQETSSVNIGGKANVDNDVVPEVDVTWFPAQKIGLELIAATSKHKLTYNSTTDVGSAWILPPTLTLQYHPLRGTDSKFSPYVGAGLNYSWFYNSKDAAGFHGLDMTGGLGYALQAGADYWLDQHWGLNLDVKKIWLNVDADTHLGTTAVHANVDLDPWVFGAGVSYRF